MGLYETTLEYFPELYADEEYGAELARLNKQLDYLETARQQSGWTPAADMRMYITPEAISGTKATARDIYSGGIKRHREDMSKLQKIIDARPAPFDTGTLEPLPVVEPRQQKTKAKQQKKIILPDNWVEERAKSWDWYTGGEPTEARMREMDIIHQQTPLPERQKRYEKAKQDYDSIQTEADFSTPEGITARANDMTKFNNDLDLLNINAYKMMAGGDDAKDLGMADDPVLRHYYNPLYADELQPNKPINNYQLLRAVGSGKAIAQNTASGKEIFRTYVDSDGKLQREIYPIGYIGQNGYVPYDTERFTATNIASEVADLASGSDMDMNKSDYFTMKARQYTPKQIDESAGLGTGISESLEGGIYALPGIVDDIISTTLYGGAKPIQYTTANRAGTPSSTGNNELDALIKRAYGVDNTAELGTRESQRGVTGFISGVLSTVAKMAAAPELNAFIAMEAPRYIGQAQRGEESIPSALAKYGVNIGGLKAMAAFTEYLAKPLVSELEKAVAVGGKIFAPVSTAFGKSLAANIGIATAQIGAESAIDTAEGKDGAAAFSWENLAPTIGTVIGFELFMSPWLKNAKLYSTAKKQNEAYRRVMDRFRDLPASEKNRMAEVNNYLSANGDYAPGLRVQRLKEAGIIKNATQEKIAYKMIEAIDKDNGIIRQLTGQDGTSLFVKYDDDGAKLYTYNPYNAQFRGKTLKPSGGKFQVGDEQYLARRVYDNDILRSITRTVTGGHEPWLFTKFDPDKVESTAKRDIVAKIEQPAAEQPMRSIKGEPVTEIPTEPAVVAEPQPKPVAEIPATAKMPILEEPAPKKLPSKPAETAVAAELPPKLVPEASAAKPQMAVEAAIEPPKKSQVKTTAKPPVEISTIKTPGLPAAEMPTAGSVPRKNTQQKKPQGFTNIGAANVIANSPILSKAYVGYSIKGPEISAQINGLYKAVTGRTVGRDLTPDAAAKHITAGLRGGKIADVDVFAKIASAAEEGSPIRKLYHDFLKDTTGEAASPQLTTPPGETVARIIKEPTQPRDELKLETYRDIVKKDPEKHRVVVKPDNVLAGLDDVIANKDVPKPFRQIAGIVKDITTATGVEIKYEHSPNERGYSVIVREPGKVIFRGAGDMNAMDYLHETVHVATAHLIDRYQQNGPLPKGSKEALNELDKLRKYTIDKIGLTEEAIIDAGGESVFYPLRNLHEFAASIHEGKVDAILSEIAPSALMYNQKATLLNRIKQAFYRIFGIQSKHTVLARAMNEMENLRQSLRPRMATATPPNTLLELQKTKSETPKKAKVEGAKWDNVLPKNPDKKFIKDVISDLNSPSAHKSTAVGRIIQKTLSDNDYIARKHYSNIHEAETQFKIAVTEGGIARGKLSFIENVSLMHMANKSIFDDFTVARHAWLKKIKAGEKVVRPEWGSYITPEYYAKKIAEINKYLHNTTDKNGRRLLAEQLNEKDIRQLAGLYADKGRILRDAIKHMHDDVMSYDSFGISVDAAKSEYSRLADQIHTVDSKITQYQTVIGANRAEVKKLRAGGVRPNKAKITELLNQNRELRREIKKLSSDKEYRQNIVDADKYVDFLNNINSDENKLHANPFDALKSGKTVAIKIEEQDARAALKPNDEKIDFKNSKEMELYINNVLVKRRGMTEIGNGLYEIHKIDPKTGDVLKDKMRIRLTKDIDLMLGRGLSPSTYYTLGRLIARLPKSRERVMQSIVNSMQPAREIAEFESYREQLKQERDMLTNNPDFDGDMLKYIDDSINDLTELINNGSTMSDIKISKSQQEAISTAYEQVWKRLDNNLRKARAFTAPNRTVMGWKPKSIDEWHAIGDYYVSASPQIYRNHILRGGMTKALNRIEARIEEGGIKTPELSKAFEAAKARVYSLGNNEIISEGFPTEANLMKSASKYLSNVTKFITTAKLSLGLKKAVNNMAYGFADHNAQMISKYGLGAHIKSFAQANKIFVTNPKFDANKIDSQLGQFRRMLGKEDGDMLHSILKEYARLGYNKENVLSEIEYSKSARDAIMFNQAIPERIMRTITSIESAIITIKNNPFVPSGSAKEQAVQLGNYKREVINAMNIDVGNIHGFYEKINKGRYLTALYNVAFTRPLMALMNAQINQFHTLTNNIKIAFRGDAWMTKRADDIVNALRSENFRYIEDTWKSVPSKRAAAGASAAKIAVYATAKAATYLGIKSLINSIIFGTEGAGLGVSDAYNTLDAVSQMQISRNAGDKLFLVTANDKLDMNTIDLLKSFGMSDDGADKALTLFRKGVLSAFLDLNMNSDQSIAGFFPTVIARNIQDLWLGLKRGLEKDDWNRLLRVLIATGNSTALNMWDAATQMAAGVRLSTKGEPLAMPYSVSDALFEAALGKNFSTADAQSRKYLYAIPKDSAERLSMYRMMIASNGIGTIKPNQDETKIGILFASEKIKDIPTLRFDLARRWDSYEPEIKDIMDGMAKTVDDAFANINILKMKTSAARVRDDIRKASEGTLAEATAEQRRQLTAVRTYYKAQVLSETLNAFYPENGYYNTYDDLCIVDSNGKKTRQQIKTLPTARQRAQAFLWRQLMQYIYGNK